MDTLIKPDILTQKEQLMIGFLADRNSVFVYDGKGDVILNNGERPSTPYSQLILDAKTIEAEKLHTEAYRVARMFLNVLGLSNIPIRFSKSDDYTNGKVITLSTDILEHKPYSAGQRLDTFIGHALHEGAHILYSDFSYLKFMKCEAHKDLLNIIEDERIERLVCEQFGGYLYFIEALKLYNFSAVKLNDGDINITAGQKILSLFFSMVRFPDTINEQWLNEHFELMMKIKDVLTPYPVTCEDAYFASNAVYDLIKDYLTEEEKKGGMGNNDSQANASEGESEGECNSKPISIFDSPNEPSGKPKQSKFTQENTEMVMVINEVAEYDVLTKTIIVPQKSKDEGAYYEIRTKVSGQIGTLRRLLQNDFAIKDRYTKALKSGELDTSMIAEVKAGNRYIYQQQKPSLVKPVTVILLIDESGSMGGSKIETAKMVAVLFREALKDVPYVNLFIYGHSSDSLFDEYGAYVNDNADDDYDYDDDDNTSLTWIGVYQEPKHGNYKSIASISAKSGNRDGYAIREVVKRVRSFTAHKALMFVLSDGMPAATGYYNGVEDTRQAVLEAEKVGIYPLQIAIGDNIRSASMFDRYVTFTDLSQMVADLGPLLRKSLSKLVA